MNKKVILAGFVVVAAFITLTAFGGKTLEQQKQEIAAEITAQLDEFRAQKQEECTIRVNEEALRQYDEYVASLPAKDAPKYSVKKRSTKPATSKDPLPQTTPSAPDSKSKWNKNDPAATGTQDSKSKWEKNDPASKDATAPVQDSKSKWKKSGGDEK